MANQGTVGPKSGLAVNTSADIRLESSAAQVVVDGHAKYKEVLYTGNVFSTCNIAAHAMSGLSATVTGLNLTNPVASGKNLVMIDWNIAVGLGPAGAVEIGLCANGSATAVTHTSAEVVRNSFITGNGTQTAVNPVSVAFSDFAATTPTAGIGVRMVGSILGSTSIGTLCINDNIDGKLILSPGSYMSGFFITTALSAAMQSCTWEECPL